MGICQSVLNLFESKPAPNDDIIFQKFEISYGNRTEVEKLDETRLNELLPLNIGGVNIRRISWKEFPGKPIEPTSYWAYICWSIQYKY